MRQFIFFKGSGRKLDWLSTGLLEGATNVQLLIKSLDLTAKYLVDNNLMGDNRISTNLIPIMTRLYRNKDNFYSEFDIVRKIGEVIIKMNSRETLIIIENLRLTSYYNIDVEAELCSHITELCNWSENENI